MLAALMTRLTGDATLAGLATGGVHLVRAPQGTALPYVVVRIFPGRIVETLGSARAGRYIRVSITGVAAGAGSTTAAAIDERIDTLLRDHALSVASPYTASPARRKLDLDDPVIDDGVEIDQVGGMYEIFVSGGAA